MIRSRQRPRVGSGSGASSSLALRLDFLSSTSLDQRVTFSRGTNATLIDSTGQLTYAPSNQVLNSENFAATSWIGVGISGLSSVGSNVAVAPDGTTTADSLVEDTLTSDHRINQAGLSGSAGKYAFSVYLKAGTRTFARIQFDGTINAVGSSCGVNVNLLDGSLSTPTNTGNITSATATVTNVGNGWYRVGLLAALSTVYSFTGASVRIFTMQSLTGSTSFLGNGSNIFVWGAQFGAMTYETAPRAYNSTSPKNLLGRTEEFDNAAWSKAQAYVQTNLLLYSEQFDVAASWSLVNINTPTANAGVSPNGTTSADKIVGNGTASGHIISQIGVASAALGTTYTTSVYVKASGYGFAFVGLNGVAYTSAPYISVNLTDGSFFTVNGAPSATSVTNAGNGWYRVSISGVTLAVGSVQLEVRPSPDGVWANRNDAQNGTDGVLAWGAQLVQGATAGDYQQTLAAAAAVQYTDPNGYLTADKLVEDATANEHFVDQPFTAISATTYTYSAYLKAGERSQAVLRFAVASVFVGGSVQVGFTLTGSGSSFPISGSPTAQSITAVGNGWYRCSISALTAAAGTPSARVQLYDGTSSNYTGNGTSGAYIWGAQVSDSASVDPYVYNPAAAITSAAYYGPRFDYDPPFTYSTNNLIPYAYPQDFGGANWSKPRASAVLTAATTDPSGSLFAYKLIEDSTPASTHLIAFQGANTAVTTGVQYTMSGYIKAAERTQVAISLGVDNGAFSTTQGGNLNLITGVVTGAVGNGLTAISVGNGWWRWAITATAAASVAFVNRVSLMSSGVSSYNGDGVSGVYIWGAQLTASAAAVPFYYYSRTPNPLGLLIEEARTNLLIYSEQLDNGAWLKPTVTVSANVITSPDGTTNADAVIETLEAPLSTAFHYINQSVTKAASSIQYATSFYIKDKGRELIINIQSGASGVVCRFNPATGNFTSNLTVFGTGWTAGSATSTVAGNGWHRVVVTATSDTTLSAVLQFALYNTALATNTYTGDGVSGVYLWGAQMEAAAFATSYIPTVAASVTRSADNATMVSNNFTNWYNQNNGTFDATYIQPTVATGAFPSVFAARLQSGNNSQNTLEAFASTANTQALVRVGNIDQASLALGGGNSLAGNSRNIAFAYKVNDFASAYDGTFGGTDINGSLINFDIFNIGWAGATVYINTSIKSISYYNTRLPDTQLQALTV